MYLFQELHERIGIDTLTRKLVDKFTSMIREDSDEDISFALDFFTAIELKGVADELLEQFEKL